MFLYLQRNYKKNYHSGFMADRLTLIKYLEIAKQSGSISQFRKEHPSEYAYCWRHGFLDLFRAMFGEQYYPPKYWEDFAHIMEAISQCDTLLELYNHYKTAYLLLKATGLFEKYTSCFEDQRRNNSSVPIEDIEKKAKGFSSTSEYALNFGNDFCKVVRLGVADRIFKHMDRDYQSPRLSIHTLEFPDNHVFIAVSTDWQSREKELLFSNLSMVKVHILVSGHQPVVKEISVDRDISNIKDCYSCLLAHYQGQNWTVLTNSIPIDADHALDDVIEIALSEKDYTSFRKNKPAAYFLALRHRFIEHVFRLYAPVAEQSNHSLGRVYSLAKTCESYSEFAEKYPEENQWAIDMGEIDQIKSLYRYYRYTTTYTLANVLSKVFEFNRFSDFRKKCPGEYAAACRNGWLEEVFKILPKETTFGDPKAEDALPAENADAVEQMKPIPKAAIKTRKNLTKESVFETARSCSTYTEFVYDHRSEYMKACNCGWLDEIKKILPLKPRNDYSKQEVMRLATLYQTYDSFVKEQPSAYAAANKNGWLEDVKRLLPPVRKGRYTKESILALAQDCLNYTVFTQKYHAAYKAACRIGITEEIKSLYLSKENCSESVNEKVANK